MEPVWIRRGVQGTEGRTPGGPAERGEASPGTRGGWEQGGPDLWQMGQSPADAVRRPGPGRCLLRRSPAAPGAPLFAHGCEHLADVGSQKIIHFVALEPGGEKVSEAHRGTRRPSHM